MPGILALDVHQKDTSKIVTGGSDKNATVFNKDTEQVGCSPLLSLPYPVILLLLPYEFVFSGNSVGNLSVLSGLSRWY